MIYIPNQQHRTGNQQVGGPPDEYNIHVQAISKLEEPILFEIVNGHKTGL